MPNTILKRWNGSTFEELYPKTTVTQISASGTANNTTFLRGDGQWQIPATQPHSHGQIDELGRITSAQVTPASNDSILITDASDSQIIKRAIQIGTSTTTFLRNDGTWQTVSGSGTVTNVTAGTQISGMSMTITNGTTTPSIATSINNATNFRTAIGAPATSHASSATTFGVGTDVNYGHVRGGKLNTSTDGEGGVSVISGTARATKTLRVDAIAQQSWGTLLVLSTSIGAGNLVRFVNLTITRVEGGITYYIGSIMIDVHTLFPGSAGTQTTNPTPTSATRWRLNSRNSSNTQLTLPIFMYRNTSDNTLRVYVDNATSATYNYECVGYF
jgi:hypothetical protein